MTAANAATYRRAQDSRPLTFAVESLHWAGPCLADGPLVAVEVRGDFVAAAERGDALAMDRPGLALPSPLLDELARRCVALGELGVIARSLLRGAIRDLRWRRALRRALETSPVTAALRPGRATLRPLGCFDAVPSHLQMGAQGLVALCGRRLVFSGGEGRVVALEEAFAHGLLFMVRDDAGGGAGHRLEVGPETVVLASWQQNGRDLGVWVRRFNEDGEVESAFVGRCPSPPQYWVACGARMWIVGDDYVCQLEEVAPATPPVAPWPVVRHKHGHDKRALWSPEPLLATPYLAIAGRAGHGGQAIRVGMLRLDDGRYEERDLPASHSPVWHEGALWGTSHEGLWCYRPGASVYFAEEGPCHGVAFGHGRVWLGCAIEGVSPHTYQVLVAPCGALFDGLHAWYVADERRVLAASELRAETSAARLGEELLAVAAGADAALIDATGVRARLRMPHDGVWLGVSAGAFIYGRKSGGIETTLCQDLVALSDDGMRQERLAWRGLWREVRRTFYAGGSTSEHGLMRMDGLWLSAGDGRWTRWRPFAAEDRLLVAPEALVDAAGASVISRRIQRGYKTSNPRDDWAEPGWEGHGCEVLLRECVLGGTTGVAIAPDVRVSGGAQVVLEACELVHGTIEVSDYSTVFVVGHSGPLVPQVDATSAVVVVVA